MVSYRGTLALIAALAVAVGLTAMGARGQTSSDDEADQSGPLASATATAKPYLLFQAVGNGNETVTAGSCPYVSCQDSCNCMAWSVPFSSTVFGPGTFTAQLNLDITNQNMIGPSGGICEQMAGFGKLSTGTGAAIALNLVGNACDVASLGKLQFSGSYTVTSGTGPYVGANGVGNATATMLNLPGTHPVAWTLIGTIKK